MHHGRLDRETALGLKELRKRIEKSDIPSSKLDESMNLATWNIREFGKKRRQKASLHYIAEIIGQFDLVAVTEVRPDLSDLAEVMKILGPYWDVVFSDFIEDDKGNEERIAYVYDKRMVTFTGLASEADAPRKVDRETNEPVTSIDWWRSPYMASFRAGNFDFVLLTAHIRWGSGVEARKKPLRMLADWVQERRSHEHNVDDDFIVLGDFNITSFRSSLYKAVTERGLCAPKALLSGKLGSNLAKDKRYDQILHYPTEISVFTDNGGVLDFYGTGHAKLYPGRRLSKDKFTYELSDHLPLWMQLKTDISDGLLNQALSGKKEKKKKKKSSR